jgi:hypothetical protein
MIKNNYNINTLITHHSVFFSMIVLYIGLVLTWYFKPPWFIDHLIYLHLAIPENLADLNFWYESGVSVLPGHHNERWAVLLPLMIVEKFLFFLSPADTSQIVILLVYLGIFYFLYRILLLNNGSLSANIYSVLFVLAVHHTKNRATEVLADPFGVLYLILAIYIITKYKKNLSFYPLFIAGALLTAMLFTKIHYGVFIILFLIWFRKEIKRIYKPVVLGSIFSIIFMDLLLFLFLEKDVFLQVNINTIDILSGYVSGGLGVSDGPGNRGWSYEWIKLMSNNIFLPITMLVSVMILASRGINYATITAWASLTFFLLIIILASFSNFPANDSYAFPIYIFSIAASAVIISEFKPKKLSNIVFVILIFIMCLSALYAISELGGVKENKFYTSFKSISIISSLIVFPLLMSVKKSYYAMITILIILGSDVFWHNWKNIENHSWWRNGYDWHYDYLDVIDDFNLNSGDYQVHFRSWPRIKGRDAREKMYIEPGIRSLNRKTLNIIPSIGETKLEVNETTSHVITDYLVTFDEFNIIKKKEFTTHPDNELRTLYLYGRQ